MKIQQLAPDYSTYQPIGDKVLLVLPREDVNDMVSQGGVIVPKNLADRNNPMRDSVVIAAGPECKQVCVGDVIRWNKNNSNPFPEGDDDLYFLPEAHALCIVKLGPAVLRRPLPPKQPMTIT